jgi:membrane protein DedA with SNARE-associated domain
VTAALLTVASASAIGGFAAATSSTGPLAAVLVCVAAVVAGSIVTHVAARYWSKRLGPSGDTIGAGGILAETTALAALSVL